MYTTDEKKKDTTQTQSTSNQLLPVLKTNLGRILAVIFLVYLYAIVRVGSPGSWSLEHGFEWSSPGYQLFPVPINWGEMGIGGPAVFVPMEIADIILYVLFVGNYIWLIWGILAVVYILHPPTIVRIKNKIFEVLDRSP
ncbi:MAG: hypothetical protein P1Q69_13540 [Candidatus Thorarchaeota archaeon]|nr:hypothetical protein [Candidatus Thorarchaeota archaeon]